MIDYPQVEARVTRAGLVARGGFHPGAHDAVPSRGDGTPVGTLILAGNAGPGMWRAFSESPEHSDGDPHPLDRWSRRVVGALAALLGAEPLFPFGGPPWHPFQRWAQRAEAVWPSPIGALIHPRHGLWHAYRGALAFAETIELPTRDSSPRPCDTCEGRPCLSACPVGAFSEVGGYDVPACIRHIGSDAGAECLGGGCLARRACPVGREFTYEPTQARLHMEAFLRANRAD